MEPKYKVKTFRGWEYARTYPEAINIAYSRVRELYKEFPNGKRFWWARIDYTFCIGKIRAYAVANEDGIISLIQNVYGKSNK